MREIRLSNGKLTKVDDEDYDRLAKFVWRIDNGYAVSTTHQIRLFMHHAVMGLPPKGTEYHHEDGDKLNNQSSNLKLYSKAAHRHQHSPGNMFGFRGVGYYVGYGQVKFSAKIKFQNKSQRIGSFDTPEEAAKAYDKQATKLFGKHAKLNFPPVDD